MKKSTVRNAIIYTRVSTTEQANFGFSLNKQEEDCKHFASKNNYNVVNIFVERGQSAKTTDRPELQALMKYCTANKNSINAVIVWKIDRLSRNMEDYYFLNGFFKTLGIDIISATETNDNTPAGKLTRNMLGAFAQFENDQKAERVIAGMKQAFMEGKWIWKAPYGYKMINGDLVQDELTAPIVKKIYELFGTGLYKQSQICKSLKNENIHISSGKIYHILRNSVYCGKMYSNFCNEAVKGDFKPIISEKLFNKVQALLHNTEEITASYNRNNAQFPLRRFILCPCCNTPLTASNSTGRKNKKYAYYHCHNKNCRTQVRIPKDKLEDLFISYLADIKPKHEYLDLLKKTLKESYNTAVKDAKNKYEKLNKDLKNIKEKRDKLLDMYIDGKIKDVDYNYKSDSYTQEENHIKMCLAQIESPKDDFNKCVEYVCNALENIDKLWIESDLDTKQRLQQLIFPQGLIYENGGFRNASNSIFFSKKGGLLPPDFKMVPPSEFESLSTP